MVSAVKRVLKADVAQRAIARHMRRKQYVDVHRRSIHVLEPRFDVPVHLRADRRQRILAARWEGDAAVLHLRSPAATVGVANAKRPTGLDLFDNRVTAAEQRVAVALRLLLCDRLTELLVRAAVFRIDVVLVEAVGALADMGIHVDHGVAVPAHGFLSDLAGGQAKLLVGN